MRTLPMEQTLQSLCEMERERQEEGEIFPSPENFLLQWKFRQVELLVEEEWISEPEAFERVFGFAHPSTRQHKTEVPTTFLMTRKEFSRHYGKYFDPAMQDTVLHRYQPDEEETRPFSGKK